MQLTSVLAMLHPPESARGTGIGHEEGGPGLWFEPGEGVMTVRAAGRVGDELVVPTDQFFSGAAAFLDRLDCHIDAEAPEALDWRCLAFLRDRMNRIGVMPTLLAMDRLASLGAVTMSWSLDSAQWDGAIARVAANPPGSYADAGMFETTILEGPLTIRVSGELLTTASPIHYHVARRIAMQDKLDAHARMLNRQPKPPIGPSASHWDRLPLLAFALACQRMLTRWPDGPTFGPDGRGKARDRFETINPDYWLDLAKASSKAEVRTAAAWFVAEFTAEIAARCPMLLRMNTWRPLRMAAFDRWRRNGPSSGWIPTLDSLEPRDRQRIEAVALRKR